MAKSAAQLYAEQACEVMLIGGGLLDDRGKHRLALAACKDDALKRWQEGGLTTDVVEKFKRAEEGRVPQALLM
jgi:hypothetical protein